MGAETARERKSAWLGFSYKTMSNSAQIPVASEVRPNETTSVSCELDGTTTAGILHNYRKFARGSPSMVEYS